MTPYNIYLCTDACGVWGPLHSESAFKRGEQAAIPARCVRFSSGRWEHVKYVIIMCGGVAPAFCWTGAPHTSCVRIYLWQYEDAFYWLYQFSHFTNTQTHTQHLTELIHQIMPMVFACILLQQIGNKNPPSPRPPLLRFMPRRRR